jgi:DNA-binding NtrC family response regulator
MARIMLVDDEENIVRALSRSLRSTGWEIVTYTNAHEALLDIEKREFAAIVSDYRMPAINGVEFLEFCKLRQPDTVRIILSAYADKDAMLQAVNTAQIFRFITKPWDDKELIMVLKQAIEQFKLVQETRRLRKIVKEQRSALEELERQHPGLVAVQRDENNAIVLEESLDV